MSKKDKRNFQNQQNQHQNRDQKPQGQLAEENLKKVTGGINVGGIAGHMKEGGIATKPITTKPGTDHWKNFNKK